MTRKSHRTSTHDASLSWQETQANYDRWSGWYDLLTGKSEQRYTRAGIQKLALQPGETVLEIGCGTGDALLDFARSQPTTAESNPIYGLDLSRKMLKIAGKKLTAVQSSRTPILTQSDARHLPYAAASFDAILMSFTLELFAAPDIPRVLQECSRVLHSSGRIALIALAKHEHPGKVEKLYEWLHNCFPKAIDCRPIFIERVIQEAGFQVVEGVEWKLYGIPVEVILARKN